MEYLFTFLEGIASFISPCLLPMLPIYISYFVGEDNKKTNSQLFLLTVCFYRKLAFSIELFLSRIISINIFNPIKVITR